jgi:hypothetical protein
MLAMLQTDGGKEFVNSKFDGYCKERGIEQQKSCRDTPQQNGKAEINGRHIYDMTLTMMIASNAPKSFWSHAASYAVYIYNHTPISKNGEIPSVAWAKSRGMEKVIDVGRLHKFGCKAIYKIPKAPGQKVGKLKARGTEGIFVGMADDSGQKGYKIWDSYKHKTVVSPDVIFDETDMPWTEQQSRYKGSESDLKERQDPDDMPDLQGSDNDSDSDSDCDNDDDDLANDDQNANDEKEERPANGQEPEMLEIPLHVDKQKSQNLRRSKRAGLCVPGAAFNGSAYTADPRISTAPCHNDYRVYQHHLQEPRVDTCYGVDPKTLKQAMESKEASRWQEAIDAEMGGL